MPRLWQGETRKVSDWVWRRGRAEQVGRDDGGVNRDKELVLYPLVVKVVLFYPGRLFADSRVLLPLARIDMPRESPLVAVPPCRFLLPFILLHTQLGQSAEPTGYYAGAHRT